MHTSEDFDKEPHKTASRLVGHMKAYQQEGHKFPEPITRSLEKLDFLLTSAKFRHMERFEDDEEEEKD